ncbi:MAG: hypothetical protein AB1346_03190 [Thermodesulfobacteriota bacterium]
MEDRSPWSILIAELAYFITVMLGIGAGYLFWKINVVPRYKDAAAAAGEFYSWPLLLAIVFAMVVVFLFTLRRILVKLKILTREESFKYLWSRSWYIKG